MSDEQIKNAIDILKRGGVVAFPTDTVYGLGASAKNEQALKKIYRIKQRPSNLALPLLLADVKDIETVSLTVPDVGWKLAKCFWPGGLTLVVARALWVSSIITSGGDTVAVRVPDHPVPRALAGGLGIPVVGTSANITGHPSPVTADEVRKQLGANVDFIIEGKCPGGVESSVVDVTREPPVLLREGAISQKEIEKACGVKLAREQKGKP